MGATSDHDPGMNILLALIPISLLLLLLAVAAFRWAVRHRQFEDLEAAALDVLREDHGPDPLPHPHPPCGHLLPAGEGKPARSGPDIEGLDAEDKQGAD